MQSLSRAVQWDIVRRTQDGDTQEAIAIALCTSRLSVRKIVAYHEIYGTVPVDVNPNYGCSSYKFPAGLNVFHMHFLWRQMKSSPHLYLDEYATRLQNTLGVTVSVSTVFRALRLLNATYKVLYRIAAQADPYLEGEFLNDMEYMPRQFIVWGDEMGTDRNAASHRNRGRDVSGLRAEDRGLIFDRKHYSCLAFMTEDGVFGHYTVAGSVDAERFLYYVREALIPKMIATGKRMLILDNCIIHKSAAFLQLMYSTGLLVKFLPAYSPWLNPTEPVFRNVKAWLRRYSEDLFAAGVSLPTMLMMAFDCISPQCCTAFIHDSGYI